MATAPLAESDEQDIPDDSARLRDVHDEALKRFDSVAVPQQELRAQSLEARRFVTIPGAQWEGAWGEQFENAPRPEVDKVSKAVEKITNDYRQNRLTVDFIAVGGSDADTADFLDGLYRADGHHFKSQQARDNAFEEAVTGGFGAYRLATDYTDPYDKDDDSQRVNPAVLIADADQSVYFDPSSKYYDKHDAKWAFVVHSYPRQQAVDEWGEDNIAEWPLNGWKYAWDWYTPETVRIAEYYVVEDREEKLYIFSGPYSDEERVLESDLDENELEDRKAKGWERKSRNVKRRRVRKYVLNGTRVLKDYGLISGDNIPIVPVYGKRRFVDGQERWWGHVQKRMDDQRTLNTRVAKLIEGDTMPSRQIPVFAPEQITPGPMQDMWAKIPIERPAYLLANPLLDAEGNIAKTDPLFVLEPSQPSQATVGLLQFSLQSLTDDDENTDEVNANVSGEAMELAAQRVDARSFPYMDNMRQSVQREGEIYQSMAREIYVEAGRKVETMDIDGRIGEETLMESALDQSRAFKIKNDLTTGRYKVVADVQEATTTRRAKTVKESLAIAQVAITAQAMDIAQAALLNAIENQDGEGMQKFQQFAHKKAVSIGLDEPTDEEKAQITQASQNQQPDPAAQALMGQAQKFAADAKLSEAKAVQTIADAHLKTAQAEELSKAPAVPTGLSTPASPAEEMDKVASARLKDAQATKIHAEANDFHIRRGMDQHQADREHELAVRQQDHAEKQVKEAPSE